ncbi:unnamed protein product [Trifolium pratense]|uniref:Uncharacterized protein n=1 Tax=Trifolium pratense TaxID=57577 RepID=A0ACB0JIZ2_TRIPR|nr:unnamed protein product [Trifolium pratense]
MMMPSACSIASKKAKGDCTTVPNWLELPREITANILQRLPTVQIVTSACLVCPQWWNICKDPLMWRTIHMAGFDYFTCSFRELAKICQYAIERSCGHLIDIQIEYFGSDDILECIAQSASNLRCMQLVECFQISDKGFIDAVRKLPKLEEVRISLCDLSSNSLEALGRSCPLLKVLRYARPLYVSSIGKEDHLALAISETMSKLCYLDIQGTSITNIGLLAILDGCPLLEYLDIDECFHLKNLSNNLRKRCIEQIKDLRLPNPNNYGEYDHIEIACKRAHRKSVTILTNLCSNSYGSLKMNRKYQN